MAATAHIYTSKADELAGDAPVEVIQIHGLLKLDEAHTKSHKQHVVYTVNSKTSTFEQVYVHLAGVKYPGFTAFQEQLRLTRQLNDNVALMDR